jgi:hypothetical protein
VSKLWFLAARQAVLPKLFIWCFIGGGVYLRTGNLHMLGSLVAAVGTYFFMVAMCRWDLQRQRRAR